MFGGDVECGADVLHPMVLTNPVTGRKAFYLTSGSARGVVGMSDEDGRRFVKDWIAYATQEQFVYRHRWQPGPNRPRTRHRVTGPVTGPTYHRSTPPAAFAGA